MMVDDEVSLLELCRELLEGDGYTIVTADDGLQAMNIYRERWEEIKLVILDLVMPYLDGGQTFLEMKKINPELKVLFCTGYSSHDVTTPLCAEEPLLVLKKPFQPSEMYSWYEKPWQRRPHKAIHNHLTGLEGCLGKANVVAQDGSILSESSKARADDYTTFDAEGVRRRTKEK